MEAIKINNVYKNFKIYYDKGATLKEKLLFKSRNKHEVHEVLKGISITINQGEVVGLIGENGSGKSTLLKLMTKIIYPNRGRIEIKGKVSSLLELGAGFHPDMTGRENIYMNASIFGLTKSEIEKRLDEIIEFSELGEFIDNPVRTYSSGMYMRLAFSVAINVDAEIILVDEILAVGDATFQKKCFDKLKMLKKLKKTIVIVSHDMTNLKKLCDKAIWINKGEVEEEGETEFVVDNYMEYMFRTKVKVEDSNILLEKQNEIEKKENKQGTIKENDKIKNYVTEEQKRELLSPSRWGTKEVEILEIKILNRDFKEEVNFKYRDKLIARIKYKSNRTVENPVFGFGLFTTDGIRCYGTNTSLDKLKIEKINIDEENIIQFTIENLDLINGIYYMNFAVHSENGYIYDYYNRIYSINIYSGSTDIGIFKPKHNWQFINY
ncbi:ABC transporter ATP-binding protein [Clostridium butyricum]|uniref:ABC transporter ATP-binding protein n=1 Tax=Clostridium butyricum TaxID=1492 RepID=UPI00374F7954